MEVIFAQVKRGIRNEKLEITSESVLKMLGALRNENYDDDKTKIPNDVV